MKNLRTNLRQKVNQFKYRNYRVLKQASLEKVVTVKENTVNESDLIVDFLLIQEAKVFVNKGSITGVIITNAVDFKNLGLVKGVIYCSNAIYSARVKSENYGHVICEGMIIQPGTILEGEITLENDKQVFLEAVRTKFGNDRAERASKLIKQMNSLTATLQHATTHHRSKTDRAEKC